jgi:hypothetical protein
MIYQLLIQEEAISDMQQAYEWYEEKSQDLVSSS